MVAIVTDIPAHRRTKLWQDKSRKPGARLLFTFGKHEGSWGMMDQRLDWQGQCHREYGTQGKGKPLKAALQEARAPACSSWCAVPDWCSPAGHPHACPKCGPGKPWRLPLRSQARPFDRPSQRVFRTAKTRVCGQELLLLYSSHNSSGQL